MERLLFAAPLPTTPRQSAHVVSPIDVLAAPRARTGTVAARSFVVDGRSGSGLAAGRRFLGRRVSATSAQQCAATPARAELLSGEEAAADRADGSNPSAPEPQPQPEEEHGSGSFKWASASSLILAAGVGAWFVLTQGTEAVIKPFVSTLSSRLAEFLPKLGFAFISIAALNVARRVSSKVLRASGSTKFAAEHAGVTRLLPMIESLADIGLISIGSLSVLGTLGIDGARGPGFNPRFGPFQISASVSAIVAGLGLTGFALGFALKDMISNFLAGILVIIFQPFKNGDLVSVQTFKGRVVNVDLRYTTLQCIPTDGSPRTTVLIPNQIILSNTVTVFH
eukprot:tig00021037_g17458.t1